MFRSTNVIDIVFGVGFLVSVLFVGVGWRKFAKEAIESKGIVEKQKIFTLVMTIVGSTGIAITFSLWISLSLTQGSMDWQLDTLVNFLIPFLFCFPGIIMMSVVLFYLAVIPRVKRIMQAKAN